MSSRERSPSGARKGAQQPKAPPAAEKAPIETVTPLEEMLPLGLESFRDKPITPSQRQIIHLQRLIGNRAVIRLLAQKAPEPNAARRKFTIQRQPTDDNERLAPDLDSADEWLPDAGPRVTPSLLSGGDEQLQISRKYLFELDEQAWTGRASGGEMKELYDHIQMYIKIYNEAGKGKTRREFESDLSSLTELAKLVRAYVAKFGTRDKNAEYVQSLTVSIEGETNMVKGRLLTIGSGEVKEGSGVPVSALVSGGSPGLTPPSARPMAGGLSGLGGGGGSLPSSVPKSGGGSGGSLGGPPPPPKERKLPPPLPTVVPTGVVDGGPSPSPSPTPVSSGGSPPMSNFERLRAEAEARAKAPKPPEFKRPEGPRKHEVVSSPSERPSAYSPDDARLAGALGSVVPVVSGPGTNIQNAVIELYTVWNEGSISLEGLSQSEQDTVEVMIGRLYAARASFVNNPPLGPEQARILELILALRRGGAGIKAQFARLGLTPEPDEDEPEVKDEKESKAPVSGGGDSGGGGSGGGGGGYVGKQLVVLSKLDREVADAVGSMGMGAYSQSLESTVTKKKFVSGVKTVAKTGISAGLSQVPGAGQAFSLVMAVNQVRSTVKHMKNIRKIRVAVNEGAASDKGAFLKDIDYLLGKKKRKAVKSAAGGIPGVGMVKTGFGLLKAGVKAMKGTKGKHRREAATRMIERAQRNDVQAKMIILELVGESHYKAAIYAPNGVDILMTKFKS